MTQFAGAVSTPTGPAYTVVLVCHVACVLLALVVALAGVVAAARLLTAKGEVAPSVRSYFSPGVNWAGRVLYLVPVFGAALLAMSNGAYSVGAPWVEWGIGLWAAAVVLAEAVLWPAERRIQRGLIPPGPPEPPDRSERSHRSEPPEQSEPPEPSPVPGTSEPSSAPGVTVAVRRACRTMCIATAGVTALVVTAMVIMTAKP